MPPEDKAKFKKVADGLLQTIPKKLFPPHPHHILVVGSAVITYRVEGPNAYQVEADTQIEAKITQILTANPAADLFPLQNSLSISIINFQSKHILRPAPTEDIELGEI